LNNELEPLKIDIRGAIERSVSAGRKVIPLIEKYFEREY